MNEYGPQWTFHFAQTYRERRWNPIPLIGKKPAIAWKEYQHRLATLGEIAHWFGHGSTYNVGVVTGKLSDLIVVEGDSPAAVQWIRDNLPHSPIQVETARGVHFGYRYSPAGNATGLLGMAIDRRGDGGYVCWPPSIHPDTGKPYQWITGFDEYNADDVPVYDPAWFAESAQRRHRDDPQRTSRSPIRNVRSYIRKIVAISGQRAHAATYRVACRLRDAGYSEAEALAEMIEWNQTNALAADATTPYPWTLRELLHKIRSAYSGSARRSPGRSR